MASGDETPPPSLRGRAISAGMWNLAALIVSQVMRLGGNLIMARLLVPEMFGVMMIATTFSVVLALFSDVGLRQSIIQSHRGGDPAFLNTAWTLQILRGVLLFGMTLLCAALVWQAQQWRLMPPDSTYAAEVLPAVLALTGFSAVISGFQSSNVALAFRSLQQSRVVLSELIGQAVGLVVMLSLGYWTRSIWSLVVAGLIAPLITVLIGHIWLSGPVSRWRLEPASIKELVAFGRWVLLSSSFGVMAMYGDRLLFAGSMSAYLLGVYSIAVLILGALEMGVHRLVGAVALPALSEAARADDRERLYGLYYRLRLPLDLGLLFACGFLFCAGSVIIDVLYDHRYAEGGGMLAVLSLSLFTLRFTLAHQVWLALGLSKYLAQDNLIRFVTLWSIVPLLLFIKPDWALWGVALHAVPTLLLVIMVNRRLGLFSWRRELMVLPMLLTGLAAGWCTQWLWNTL